MPPPDSVVLVAVEPGLRGGQRHGPRLARLAHRCLATRRLRGVELSLSLVSDRAIARLKHRWFGVRAATDVLSFPAGEGPSTGLRPLGDVVISLDTARRSARALNTPLDHELALYLAHGLLHLLGFDHTTGRAGARKMAAAERRLLGHLGLLGRSDETD